VSSFGGLNTAYTGLSAARAALEVTGQNVANANTEGYTRQRVVQSPIAQTSLATYATQSTYGDGVTVTGVARLNDAVVDARVNSTAAASAYWSTAASAASSVETSLSEPGSNGLTKVLSDFWNDWQQMANNPGSPSIGNTLIAQGELVASTVSAGYTAAQNAWTEARSAANTTAAAINTAAAQVADLNSSIRSLTAAGSSVNSLLDQRDAAVNTLAKLTGATTRGNPDGTVDVVVGGNALVSGSTSRPVALTGAANFSVIAAPPLALVWSGTTPPAPVSLDGGEMAARIASLQPADTATPSSGTGGVFAEAAKAYDDIAKNVADRVNALHEQGTTSAGLPGTTGTPLDFFSYSATSSPALSLSVVPSSVAGIAAADGTKGSLDNTVADRIAQLGTGLDSPNAAWGTYVSRLGSQVATASARATTADTAATAATTAQNSNSGVDLDEETANLVVYQHAYQASARVISTINDVLDTLINMGAR
jgi:flagellar hook-associated protein 1 FlgK